MASGAGQKILLGIAGFILGIASWAPAFFIAFIIGGHFFRSVGGVGWTMALIMFIYLLIVIGLLAKFRRSPMAIGALISICIGLLLSAFCGVINPRIGG
jgi:hypothetical protein